MIKFEKTRVEGWEAAIRGMRNPFNSWDKSDSCFDSHNKQHNNCSDEGVGFHIGPADLKRMKTLIKSGSDHSKFMRMITVTVDITAPLYWWKEFDTYKVGTVRNSCSTMHKLPEKEFTLDDFSCEHIKSLGVTNCDALGYTDCSLIDNWTLFRVFIEVLNYNRKKFIETNDKKFWWQMIQLLPSSYNQKATVQLNYAVLGHMYHARKNHRLDEWREGFTSWVKTLPYSELITD